MNERKIRSNTKMANCSKSYKELERRKGQSGSFSYDSRDEKQIKSRSRTSSIGVSRTLSERRWSEHSQSRVSENTDTFDIDLKELQQEMERQLKSENLPKALTVSQEILEKVISRFDKRHVRVSTAWHNLGHVQLKAKKHVLALKSMLSALEIREATLGLYHPLIIESLIEIGIIQLFQRQFQESLDTFLKAIDINNPKDTSKIPLFAEKYNLIQAKLYNNIGCVYLECGSHPSALTMFEKALYHYEKLYSKTSFDFFNYFKDIRGLSAASTFHNIAYIHMVKGNFKLAISALESALEIQKRILSLTDQRLVETLVNLGYCNVQLKKYNAALENYEDILEIHTIALDRNHIERGANMKNMVIVHLHLKQYEEAYNKALRVVDIEERHLSCKDINLVQTRNLLNTLEKCLENLTMWNSFMIEMKNLSCNMFPNIQSQGNINVPFDFEIIMPEFKSQVAGHQVRII